MTNQYAPRPRLKSNPLREWLEADPQPMSKAQFALMIGCTGPYLSMLLADNPPWPNRRLQLRIAAVTNGAVDPNRLAGWL